MADASVRGYKHIGRSRGGDFLSANGLNHVSPPEDRYRMIQMAMVLAGIGFLLPYNCFTFAVDYYQDKFPNSTIIFDLSITYIIMALVAVTLNNIFVDMLSLSTRIIFGYTIALVTLVFVAIFEIQMDLFSHDTSYYINLAAIGIVALGCTIQQSSYYGYTSMLPTRYTQAFMAGEGAAGVWVSVIRIITKLVLDDEKLNTEVFFFLTTITVILCWIMYVVVRRTAFVEFYITLCQETRTKIVLEPTDTGLMDLESNKSGTHIATDRTKSSTSAQEDNSQFSNLSFANPVYEPNSKGLTTINEAELQYSGPTFKVEDVITRPESTGRWRKKTWTSLKSGLRARWLVAQQIYPYMVCIALSYFVTLCLYPGILSEIVSCRFGSWMPIILMAICNFGDLFGKMFAPAVSEWARSKMAAWCSLRLLLLPLLLMCCAPRGAPHAAATGDVGPMVLTFILGASGGTLGAAPMLAASQRVRNDAREMAGNIMTVSYNVGLTTGSFTAYLLEAMLGPQVATPCGAVYPTIGAVTRAVTASTPTAQQFNATVAAAVITEIVTGVSLFTQAYGNDTTDLLYPITDGADANATLFALSNATVSMTTAPTVVDHYHGFHFP